MPGCLTCPRRYRHRYLDGWKERDTRAAMLFGRAFEQALGAYFRREDSGAVSAAADIETRAVRIRPDIVRRLTPLDMNIVFQRLELATDQGFDLIIGTNIFIYYDAFEQSLARANLATMLRPGGYLLSNDKFPIPFPLDWPAR
jgi:chemotaxis methyl-accepting protein methylase